MDPILLSPMLSGTERLILFLGIRVIGRPRLQSTRTQIPDAKGPCSYLSQRMERTLRKGAVPSPPFFGDEFLFHNRI